MKINNFISLHRKILEWEWYSDINTCRLFIHLLLNASFQDTNYYGVQLKRGQILTSTRQLASETNLSHQQVRTCLKNLTHTKEIFNTVSNTQYTIITICNYNTYQFSTNKSNTRSNTRLRQKVTHEQHTSNTRNEIDNINLIYNNVNNVNKESVPSLKDVVFYFKEKNIKTVSAQEFYDYYTARDWEIKGTKIKNWKSCVTSWIKKSDQFDKKPINPLSEYMEL